jgi:hypothetical protein
MECQTEDIDINKIIEKIDKIPMNLVDFKKYRKYIKRKFDAYKARCRFFLYKQYDIKYSDSVKGICLILFKLLDNPNTFAIGNHHFLLSLIESHFDYLKLMSQRASTLDAALLNLLFDSIIEKNIELKNVLISNMDKPVTKEQFIEFIKQKERSTDTNAGRDSEKSGK